MAMYRRVPVETTVESRVQHTGFSQVRGIAQYLPELVRVLLADTIQSQLAQPGGFFPGQAYIRNVRFWNGSWHILSYFRTATKRQQQDERIEPCIFHCGQFFRLARACTFRRLVGNPATGTQYKISKGRSNNSLFFPYLMRIGLNPVLKGQERR